MAAVLSLYLANAVAEVYKTDQMDAIYWTGNVNVLWWVINHSRKFKPFVANRISEIQVIITWETESCKNKGESGWPTILSNVN